MAASPLLGPAFSETCRPIRPGWKIRRNHKSITFQKFSNGRNARYLRSSRQARRSQRLHSRPRKDVQSLARAAGPHRRDHKNFSPETDPEAIPPRRKYRRSGYFKKAEFARLYQDELRKADGQPVTTATIVSGIIRAKGLPEDTALAESLTERVLSYLRVKRKAGMVIKIGASRDAKWTFSGSI